MFGRTAGLGGRRGAPDHLVRLDAEVVGRRPDHRHANPDRRVLALVVDEQGAAVRERGERGRLAADAGGAGREPGVAAVG